MSDEGFAAISSGSKLKRTEIMKAIDCDRPALRQNKRLKQKIDEVENELRARGVLPSVTRKGLSETKKFRQRGSEKVVEHEHLSHLEKENLELKAQVRQLKEELSRYEEFSSVLYELGTLPR